MSNRPTKYAKHAGRSHRKSRHETQLALDVDVEWHVNVRIEFGLWLAARRAQGLREFTVEEFRAVAKAVPSHANSWGTFSKSIVKHTPGIEAVGHVRSKVPSAHRRLVNQYRDAA